MTEARVDDHPPALPEIDRLFEADDRRLHWWAADPLIVIAIRGDRAVVDKVIAPHLFLQMRETPSPALAAVRVVQILGSG